MEKQSGSTRQGSLEWRDFPLEAFPSAVKASGSFHASPVPVWVTCRSPAQKYFNLSTFFLFFFFLNNSLLRQQSNSCSTVLFQESRHGNGYDGIAQVNANAASTFYPAFQNHAIILTRQLIPIHHPTIQTKVSQYLHSPPAHPILEDDTHYFFFPLLSRP